MELNHLRYFYEVAKCGGFTQASKKLRISQPSISKIVRLLEDRQGVKLFDRQKKGVTLTRDGELFYRSCERIFAEVEQLAQDSRSLSQECQGELAIGASDNICNYLLPKLIPSFWEKHPKVNFNLLSGTSQTVKEDLIAGRSELGLFYTPADEPVFETRKLAFVEFALLCSTKNLLFKNAKTADPKLLEKAYYIGSRRADYPSLFPAMQRLVALGIRPKLFFETNNQETQKRLAMEEMGYTVLPLFMVQEEIRAGKLKILTTPKKIGKDILLVTRKNRHLSRPAREFIKKLEAELPKIL